MSKIIKSGTFWISIIVLLMAGCADGPVLRSTSDSFVLGRTTLAEVAGHYGWASKSWDRIFRNKTVHIVMYLQASDSSDKPYRLGLSATRAARYYFVENILIGHDFDSSWASDTTDFDMTLIERVKEGQSTRAQVVDLLGKPVGYYKYPLIEEQAHEALVYLYQELAFTRPGVRANRKEVIIAVDQVGVVKSIKYELRDDSLLAPGADRVKFTQNAADVAGCKAVGKVSAPDLSTWNVEIELRNRTVGLDGNTVFRTKFREGVAYRCP